MTTKGGGRGRGSGRGRAPSTKATKAEQAAADKAAEKAAADADRNARAAARAQHASTSTSASKSKQSNVTGGDDSSQPPPKPPKSSRSRSKSTGASESSTTRKEKAKLVSIALAGKSAVAPGKKVRGKRPREEGDSDDVEGDEEGSRGRSTKARVLAMSESDEEISGDGKDKAGETNLDVPGRRSVPVSRSRTASSRSASTVHPSSASRSPSESPHPSAAFLYTGAEDEVIEEEVDLDHISEVDEDEGFKDDGQLEEEEDPHAATIIVTSPAEVHIIFDGENHVLNPSDTHPWPSYRETSDGKGWKVKMIDIALHAYHTLGIPEDYLAKRQYPGSQYKPIGRMCDYLGHILQSDNGDPITLKITPPIPPINTSASTPAAPVPAPAAPVPAPAVSVPAPAAPAPAIAPVAAVPSPFHNVQPADKHGFAVINTLDRLWRLTPQSAPNAPEGIIEGVWRTAWNEILPVPASGRAPRVTPNAVRQRVRLVEKFVKKFSHIPPGCPGEGQEIRPSTLYCAAAVLDPQTGNRHFGLIEKQREVMALPHAFPRLKGIFKGEAVARKVGMSEMVKVNLGDAEKYLNYCAAEKKEPIDLKNIPMPTYFQIRPPLFPLLGFCLVFAFMFPGVFASSTAGALADPFKIIDNPDVPHSGLVMILLSVIVLQNADFLRHHYLQQRAVKSGARQQRGLFYATAWIRRFHEAVFALPLFRDIPIDPNDAHKLILQVASRLNLSHSYSADSTLFPSFPLILPLPFVKCQVCGEVLHATRGALDIWVLMDDGPHRAQMMQGNCSNAECNTSHFPDRYHIRVNGKLTAYYASDAAFLRIGRNVWASRNLAISHTHLRHRMHASTESLVTYYNERYCTSSEFKLTRRHAWRLFVLHESLQMCRERGARLIHPTYRNTTQLCAAMRTKYFGGDVKVIPGALDHRCGECVHPHRAYDAEADVVITIDGEEDDMVVGDGLSMGHRRCAMPKCENSAQDVRSKKLCAEHAVERAGRCGIVSCNRQAETSAANEGACSLPAHQKLWHDFRRSRNKDSFGAYRRVIQNENAVVRSGDSGRTPAWVRNGRRRVAQVTTAPDDSEVEVPHHHRTTRTTRSQTRAHRPRGRSQTRTSTQQQSQRQRHQSRRASRQRRLRRVQHLWQYRFIHCIETLTRPCGCILAWAKFATSESPTNIINMLRKLFRDGLPSYVVIDKACRLLATLRGPELEEWFETSRLLVDTFHYENHAGDPDCAAFCNPTPPFPQNPNLVLRIPNTDPVIYQRAFNTEAAEQLNAWFGKYAGQLSHMNPANHDFLIQVMLTRQFNAVSSR